MRSTGVAAHLLPAGGILVCGVLACSTGPVTWRDVNYPPRAPIVRREPGVASIPAGACPGSVRAARAGSDLYATWWHVRSDSSAVLMAGRSTDGGRSWPVTVSADPSDRSRRGCDRPAPAILADSATGYLDLAYFLEPGEGAGVFYTHSMDAAHLGAANGVFHSPVAIVYGARPARVAVAAQADDVAVAYEDPNSERGRIAVALSRSMGHIFRDHSDVSSAELPGADPAVKLVGDTLVVQWMERPDSVNTGGRAAVRRGVWR